MNVESAYDQWSSQYDENRNKTRDLEALAIRETLAPVHFTTCLEIGCGTGKNTLWLLTKAASITAIDLSSNMLAKAREKISNMNVVFQQADVTDDWHFTTARYDLITFSLVLEHIENLDHVFQQASKCINPGGHVYIGELHPFKQYTGAKQSLRLLWELKSLRALIIMYLISQKARPNMGSQLKTSTNILITTPNPKCPGF